MLGGPGRSYSCARIVKVLVDCDGFAMLTGMERPNWVFRQDQEKWLAHPEGNPQREVHAASFDELQIKVRQQSQEFAKSPRELPRVERSAAEQPRIDTPRFVIPHWIKRERERSAGYSISLHKGIPSMKWSSNSVSSGASSSVESLPPRKRLSHSPLRCFIRRTCGLLFPREDIRCWPWRLESSTPQHPEKVSSEPGRLSPHSGWLNASLAQVIGSMASATRGVSAMASSV